MVRWNWIVLMAVVLSVGVLLAWADSTILRQLFPQPTPGLRRTEIKGHAALAVPPALLPGPGRAFVFGGFGPVGGPFSFWWFLTTGAGVVLLATAALVVFPARVRRAAQRLAGPGLSLAFAAGVAAALLGVAVTFLMRATFVLLSLVPIVWATAGVGALFGISVLAVLVGRWLRTRLGPVPILVGAMAGLLLFFDVALIPVLGWIVLVILGVTGLGLAVLTRLGSPSGWGLRELDW